MSFANPFQKYSNDFGLGHNGVRISLNYFEGIPEPQLYNSLQSNELVLIFKSLTKRDEVTKEKALIDLLSLLVKGNLHLFDDDIFRLCWSQVYPKLLVSESKSIRVQAHQTTIRLIALLNRKLSKFLKDLIPFVLLGTCDSDNTVAKTCSSGLLSECFQNNHSKVDALWLVFHEQLLELVKNIIIVETEESISDERYVDKELAELKYNRLVTNAIELLNSTILRNTESMGKLQDMYSEILSSDTLWKMLSLKNPKNYKLYTSLLTLTDNLYQVEYFQSHSEILKQASKKLIKSLAQVNARNVINLSTILNHILASLTLLTNYNDGEIWYSAKTSGEKLNGFLNVCCKNPPPRFFKEMYLLSEKLSEFKLMTGTLNWSALWHMSINSLNDRTFLGRYGPQLLEECCTYYFKFVRESSDEELEKAKESDVLAILQSNIALSKLPNVLAVLKDSISCQVLSSHITNLLAQEQAHESSIQNTLCLILASTDNELALHTVLEDFLKHSQSKSLLSLICRCYGNVISSQLMFTSSGICSFIDTIPSLVDQDSYEELANIIILYCNSNFNNESNFEQYMSSMNKFLDAVTSIGVPTERIINLFEKIPQATYNSLLASKAGETMLKIAYGYISSYSFEDDGKFLKSNILGPGNIIDFYNLSKEKNQTNLLCKHIQKLDNKLQQLLLSETDLICTLFDVPDETSRKLFDSIMQFIQEDNKISMLVEETITKHVMEQGKGKLDTEYAIKLLECKHLAINSFFRSDWEEFFIEYVPHLDYRISQTNHFGTNLYLTEYTTETLNLSQVRHLLNYGCFLDELVQNKPKFLDDNIIFFLTMLGELAMDYNSLSAEPQENYYDNHYTYFKNKKLTATFEDIIESVTQPELSKAPNDLHLFTRKRSKNNKVIEFFRVRILYRILLNAMDNASNKKVDETLPVLEKYLTRIIRDSAAEDYKYLNIATILLALQEFSLTKSFDKLRTIILSECIGNKIGDIVAGGYKKLILLIDILPKHDRDGQFLPATPQRLNMLLSTINQWLDSDVVYDEEFSVPRIMIMQLFNKLLVLPAVAKSVGSKLLDTASRILADSLSLCQLEDTTMTLELRSCALEMYQALSKHDRALWTEEYVDEISNGILELPSVDFTGEDNNILSSNFYLSLYGILKTLPTKELSKYHHRYFDNFVENKEMKNLSRTRLVVGYLERLIYVDQQDAVIEYELHKKSHANDSTSNDIRSESAHEAHNFKIPANLIEIMSRDTPQEYLEYEDSYHFIRYLWTWHLAMCYFKDISYNLRQHLIEQLKEKDLVNHMFDFISDQIDLHDSDFWDSVKAENILEYTVDKEGFSPYRTDVFVECKILLVHSMFELFNNVGSVTSTWWLNIKDRTLQKNIERFVIKFISPILIKQELGQVEENISRLSAKDDSLSIKINTITNEVKANYLIDEQKLEISFKLPENYPLTDIQVVGVSRVGISEQKWKQWIMSTQRVITGMNGTVMDSLELFTKNVNLQFSGFEECAICYSILHAIDHKLPTKTCTTCNNKFHGACLYKWFRSSGNNTCPLCRSEIRFRR